MEELCALCASAVSVAPVAMRYVYRIRGSTTP